MIHFIENLPTNMVGFRAIGDITENDFIETVVPKVNDLIDKTDKLNYLLVLETSIKNFTVGAWIKDALMGIKHITKWNRAAIVTWNRAAIVTDVDAIRSFTEIFSYFTPGEFRGFEHKDLQEAIDWVSEKK